MVVKIDDNYIHNLLFYGDQIILVELKNDDDEKIGRKRRKIWKN